MGWKRHRSDFDNELHKTMKYTLGYIPGTLQKKRKVPLENIPQLESLPSLVDRVLMQDTDIQLEAITQLRKLLCIDTHSVDEVVKAGLVPRFIKFLKQANAHQLQFEAAWALTNIASGEDKPRKVIIDHGAVPVFVALLNSPYDDVREQAIWALGNMVTYSYGCKKSILNCGFVELLLGQLNAPVNTSILRIATWTLANFCLKQSFNDFHELKPALPVIERLLHLKDEEILIDACRALQYLCHPRFSIRKSKDVIDAGVCPRLVELMSHRLSSVRSFVIQTIGYIADLSDDMQIQYIVNLNILPVLSNLLKENTSSIRALACGAIGSIIQGTQIKAAIEANIMGPLLDFLHCAKSDFKYDALRPLVYVITSGTHEQIGFLVNQGCIKHLCDVLECGHDEYTLRTCFEGLTKILELGEAEKAGRTGEINIYAKKIEEAGGLQKLQNIIYEAPIETKLMAALMLRKYF